MGGMVTNQRSTIHRFIIAWGVGALASATLVTGSVGASVPPASDPDPVAIAQASDDTYGYPSLTVIATDTGFVVPDGITAGRYFMTTHNAGTSWSHYFTLRIPDDVSDDDLAVAMASDDDPEWLSSSEVVGNADQTLPGKDTHSVVDLPAGRFVLIDPIRGLAGRVDVAAATSSAAPSDPPADFEVDMREMQFVGIPESVPAGRSVLRVTNGGTEWHEAVIMHVADGATVDGLIDEFSAMGDGPDDGLVDSIVGGSAVVSPGITTWMVVDLEPGTYAMVCLVPNDDGVIHAMLGMIGVFTVS